MKIIRTEKQVALQDLLTALQETADLFRDVANYLDEPSLSRELEDIAEERDRFLPELEKRLRENEELPSEPDRDRESGKKLISRLLAAVDSNPAGELLMEREKDEERINEALAHCRKIGMEEEYGELLQALDEHSTRTHQRLQRLLTEYHD